MHFEKVPIPDISSSIQKGIQFKEPEISDIPSDINTNIGVSEGRIAEVIKQIFGKEIRKQA